MKNKKRQRTDGRTKKYSTSVWKGKSMKCEVENGGHGRKWLEKEADDTECIYSCNWLLPYKELLSRTAAVVYSTVQYEVVGPRTMSKSSSDDSLEFLSEILFFSR